MPTQISGCGVTFVNWMGLIRSFVGAMWCSGGRGVGLVDGFASLTCGSCHARAVDALPSHRARRVRSGWLDPIDIVTDTPGDGSCLGAIGSTGSLIGTMATLR